MAKLTLHDVQAKIDAGDIGAARALFNHGIRENFRRKENLRADITAHFVSKGWSQPAAEAEAERLAP